MKTNFVAWHYGDGLRELFRAWSSSVFFIEWKWNIFGLMRTFFSPWKRDVTFRNWVGFHPLRLLNIFISNGISRAVGAFVRSWVIVIGVILFFLVFFFGLAVFILWLVLPFLFLVSLFLFLNGAFLFSGGVGAVFLAGVFCSALGYAETIHKEQSDEAIADRKKRRWFPRALARVGLTLKEVPKVVLKDQAAWEAFLAEKGFHVNHFEAACTLERERFRSISTHTDSL
jgi:hypothetical protein